jgi:ABC-type nitrate/sulfonate/bicarbonate transport system substrate-binding protein
MTGKSGIFVNIMTWNNRSMNRKLSNLKTRYRVMILAALIVLPVLLGPSACQVPPQRVTIGLGASAPGFAPFYVARDQGYFANNGLDVTIRGYDSGQGAVQGLLNNEVDLAGTTEYPVVGCAFNKSAISVLVTANKSMSFFVTARQDLGIKNISDLKAKRIGLQRGTIAEFYLGRFLELNGLKLSDVNLVSINQTSAIDSIKGGKVDAVVVSQPYSYDIAGQLGSNGLAWSVQNQQAVFQNVVAGNDWIAGHSDLVTGFLKALAQAEDFIVSHPAEAMATQQKLLNNVDAGFLPAVWAYQQFSLSLDQSLIVAMEDEARWMIGNNLTTQKQVPDFLKFLYVDGLQKVRPTAVNIIR